MQGGAIATGRITTAERRRAFRVVAPTVAVAAALEALGARPSCPYSPAEARQEAVWRVAAPITGVAAPDAVAYVVPVAGRIGRFPRPLPRTAVGVVTSAVAGPVGRTVSAVLRALLRAHWSA